VGKTHKAKVCAVTGYIPLPHHPRETKEYHYLGEKLRELKVPLRPFYQNVTSTWMFNLIEKLSYAPTWAVADNGEKNSLGYHCVQHQKFQWLYEASRMDKEADTFVWLDFGVCHQPNVTVPVINECLGRIKKGDFAIPGCWSKGEVNDEFPCWRFCGSFLIVPREHIQKLKNLIQSVALLYIGKHKHVTWEVNTLARVEQTSKLPIRWYLANHDQSQFENYR
jgi:hypothetical protein